MSSEITIHMLVKGGLGLHDPTSLSRFVLLYISNTGYAIAMIFTVNNRSPKRM